MDVVPYKIKPAIPSYKAEDKCMSQTTGLSHYFLTSQKDNLIGKYTLMVNSQHGFRQNRSTSTELKIIVD